MLFFVFQDGGCTCPGDVAKAIGAGADFVMLGGMLAGHDQVKPSQCYLTDPKFPIFFSL
jgi:GMP reductase